MIIKILQIIAVILTILTGLISLVNPRGVEGFTGLTAPGAGSGGAEVELHARAPSTKLRLVPLPRWGRICGVEVGEAFGELQRGLEAVGEARLDALAHDDAVDHDLDVVLVLLVERGGLLDLVERTKRTKASVGVPSVFGFVCTGEPTPLRALVDKIAREIGRLGSVLERGWKTTPSPTSTPSCSVRFSGTRGGGGPAMISRIRGTLAGHTLDRAAVPRTVGEELAAIRGPLPPVPDPGVQAPPRRGGQLGSRRHPACTRRRRETPCRRQWLTGYSSSPTSSVNMVCTGPSRGMPCTKLPCAAARRWSSTSTRRPAPCRSRSRRSARFPTRPQSITSSRSSTMATSPASRPR